MNEKTPLIPNGIDTTIAILSSQRSSASSKYPAPFFDPVTNRVMKDPVVAPGSGISYERSSWEAFCQNSTNPPAPAYENRALKQIIEETIVEKDDILQENFRRSSQMLNKKVQQNLRKNIAELLEKSMLPTDDLKALSEAYYCPITYSLMRQPMIGPEGYSFEKAAIEQWIDANQVSPITRTPLPSRTLLYPNTNLKEMLLLEVAKISDNDERESIQEYKSDMWNQQTAGNGSNKKSSFFGAKNLKEWETLREKRRHTNMRFTCKGLINCIIGVLFLLIGSVVGLVLAVFLLIIGTVLDLFVVPIIQCFGGCQGGSDAYEDEFIPFESFHRYVDSEKGGEQESLA